MTTRDDDLLALLGRAGREGLDVSADRRWDALSGDEISAEDRAALEAIAAQSEEGREAFEAFRPIGAGARAQMTEDVLASLNTAATREEQATSPARSGEAMADVVGAGESAARPANDAAGAPSSRRRWVGAVALATSLAAAAAFALIVRWGRPPPLPGYAITVTGEHDERATPAPDGDVVRLGPGARLRIVLRPDHRVEGPIAVRGFLARANRWTAWDVPATVAPDGAVLILGAREDLFPGAAPGLCTIALAVGRKDALPSTPDALARAHDGEAIRVMRIRVDLHDGGSP
ncbi:MAG: hypothetical protein QM820_07705 [Minicystis sp.]